MHHLTGCAAHTQTGQIQGAELCYVTASVPHQSG